MDIKLWPVGVFLLPIPSSITRCCTQTKNQSTTISNFRKFLSFHEKFPQISCRCQWEPLCPFNSSISSAFYALFPYVYLLMSSTCVLLMTALSILEYLMLLKIVPFC